MSNPEDLKRELSELLVRAMHVSNTAETLEIGGRIQLIVAQFESLLENAGDQKTAGESEQGTGINMPKRVCMSNPEDLKRELSDLLVERKNLRHTRNTWLCAKEQCVDGELYVTEQAQYQVDTTRMSVIDARINEICGQAT